MPKPDFPTLLDEALEAWEYTRAGVVAEAEGIPADRFDYRPTEASRTVAEVLVHIIGSGQMMSGELSRADGDFTRQSYPEHVREHAGELSPDLSKDELVKLLRSTGEAGRARIREAGELAMLQGIRQFDGSVASRLSWMSHGIAHESYHRGQIALYARLMGEVPALTRRIRGE